MTNVPDIVLRRNNVATHEPCAICGDVDLTDIPFTPALEGTESGWGRVCWQCFEKHWGGRYVAQAFRYVLDFLADPERPQFVAFHAMMVAHEFPPRRPTLSTIK